MIELQDISDFESSSSFTNTFKKFTGSAPKKYKNEMTELFSEVKSFESSNEYHAVEYYEKQDTSYCSVTIKCPKILKKDCFLSDYSAHRSQIINRYLGSLLKEPN